MEGGGERGEAGAEPRLPITALSQPGYSNVFTSQTPGERGPAGPRHPQPTGLHVSRQGRGLLHCGDSHKGRSSEASSTETKKQQLAVSESVKTINQTKRQKSCQRLFHLIMLHKEDHEAEVRDRLRLHLLPQQQRHCDQPG